MPLKRGLVNLIFGIYGNDVTEVVDSLEQMDVIRKVNVVPPSCSRTFRRCGPSQGVTLLVRRVFVLVFVLACWNAIFVLSFFLLFTLPSCDLHPLNVTNWSMFMCGNGNIF